MLSLYRAIDAPVATAQISQFDLVKIPNMPSNFFLTKLGNGLEVLVIEDHTVPLATIELVVRNGAFVQTPELEGLAHLYEHMFFKANKTYPSQEKYLERVNELGISFNGTTSDERVNYFVTLNKSKLQEGLDFMNSAARYPLFLKEEMEKENVVVAGEFQRNESNPFFFLNRDMRKHLWGKEFSRKNTIGEYPVILNATPEIMTDIKNRYYYPNNSMLVIAGDVEHNDVFTRVKNVYGDWQRSSFDIFQKYPIPEFDPIPYSKNFITESEIAQVPILMISWHGPDTRHDLPATYAADVFSYILSQQSSKLQKALVETGLAYQVIVNYSTQKYTGPITVIMVPNPARTEEATKVLWEHIAQWDDPNYITDDQIATAKEMLDIEDQYSKEQTSQYVHTVTYWWASASLDYYSNYVNNIKRVNRNDIQDYVRKYIKGKPHISGLLISPEMRGMIPIDSFFTVTEGIENYALKAAGNDNLTFDGLNAKSLAGLVELLRLNPDKKVTVTAYAEKSRVAETRVVQLKDKLKELGISADRLVVNKSVIRKAKDVPEAEKDKQNTIQFSF
jgi:zinc protease